MEKPGWKTTEFWLTLAAVVVGTLLATGVWGEGDTAYTVLAFIASALTALGYTHGRSKLKTAEVLSPRGIGTSPAQDTTADPPQS